MSTLAGDKEVARRWLAGLTTHVVGEEYRVEYRTPRERLALLLSTPVAERKWAEACMRSRQREISLRIASAATEDDLATAVYLHQDLVYRDLDQSEPKFHTAHRLDWKKITMTMPEYAVHGRIIARAVDRAMLNPYTVLGKRRLEREFERMTSGVDIL